MSGVRAMRIGSRAAAEEPARPLRITRARVERSINVIARIPVGAVDKQARLVLGAVWRNAGRGGRREASGSGADDGRASPYLNRLSAYPFPTQIAKEKWDNVTRPRGGAPGRAGEVVPLWHP